MLKYMEVGLHMRRITLNLLPGLGVEFVDRDRALAQVVEWAEKSTRWPVVVFGPEGCGKTAFLRQAAETLRELGYDVFYLHPLDRFLRLRFRLPTSRRPFWSLWSGLWLRRLWAAWRGLSSTLCGRC